MDGVYALTMRDMILSYGWIGVPLAVAAWFVIRNLRRRAQRERSVRRREKRIRNIAHQRAWDWLIGSSRRLRITHVPEKDSER